MKIDIFIFGGIMSGPIEIKKVTNKKMLNEFIKLPWKAKLYENDPAWVPPVMADLKAIFNKKKSHFYEMGEGDLFLAYKDGKTVGRITAHVNHVYEDVHDNETGFFGFYESIDDPEVSKALYDTAADWLRAKNKKRMQGPQSFSIYDDIGFEVQGIDKTPIGGLFHSAGYYKDLATSYGFEKKSDWYSLLVNGKVLNEYVGFLDHIQADVQTRNVKFIPYNKKEFKKRSEELRVIFNEAWKHNWGHIPMSKLQAKKIFEPLNMIVIPELVLFAEIDGKTVGYICNIPDISEGLKALNGKMYPWRLIKFLREIKKAKTIRTIIMGVLPEHRGKNIDNFFYLQTIKKGLELGFTASDCSLIAETNKQMLKNMEPLKPDRYKTYRLYEKEI